MIINKNTWHYKIYKHSYFFIGEAPYETNLCQYIRRLALSPLIYLLSAIAIASSYLMLSIIMVIRCVGMVPFGWRPEHIEPLTEFVEYNGLKLGKFMLYPWHVIVPCLLAFIHYEVVHHFGWKPVWFVDSAVLTGIVVGLLCILFLTRAPLGLVYNYIEAKKQGICPIVKFEDDKLP